MQPVLIARCPTNAWHRVVRVTATAPLLLVPTLEEEHSVHPGLPNATNTMCWFSATLHVLACHTGFMQALSEAVLTESSLRMVAKWIAALAVLADNAVLSADAFVQAAQRVTRDVSAVSVAEFPGQTSAASPASAPRTSVCTDRASAAFVLALHIVRRLGAVHVHATTLRWLLFEAVLIRAKVAGDLLDVLAAPHVFASPSELMQVLLRKSAACNSAFTAHCSQRVFWRAAGLEVFIDGVLEWCVELYSTSEEPISLQKAITTVETSERIPRRVVFDRWLVCDVTSVTGPLIGISADVSVSTECTVRVVAFAALRIGSAHYVAFVRTLDGWTMHDDEITSHGVADTVLVAYQPQMLLLERVLAAAPAPLVT